MYAENIPLVLVTAVLCALLARWVWDPLYRAAGAMAGSPRFDLFDKVVLALYLAAVFAAPDPPAWTFRQHGRWLWYADWSFVIFAYVFAGSVWWLMIHKLASAGITQLGRRAKLLLVGVPLTLLGLMAVTVSLIILSERWVRGPLEIFTFLGLMLLGAAFACVRRAVGKISKEIDDEAGIFDDELWRASEEPKTYQTAASAPNTASLERVNRLF